MINKEEISSKSLISSSQKQSSLSKKVKEKRSSKEKSNQSEFKINIIKDYPISETETETGKKSKPPIKIVEEIQTFSNVLDILQKYSPNPSDEINDLIDQMRMSSNKIDGKYSNSFLRKKSLEQLIDFPLENSLKKNEKNNNLQFFTNENKKLSQTLNPNFNIFESVLIPVSDMIGTYSSETIDGNLSENDIVPISAIFTDTEDTVSYYVKGVKQYMDNDQPPVPFTPSIKSAMSPSEESLHSGLGLNSDVSAFEDSSVFTIMNTSVKPVFSGKNYGLHLNYKKRSQASSNETPLISAFENVNEKPPKEVFLHVLLNSTTYLLYFNVEELISSIHIPFSIIRSVHLNWKKRRYKRVDNFSILSPKARTHENILFYFYFKPGFNSGRFVDHKRNSCRNSDMLSIPYVETSERLPIENNVNVLPKMFFQRSSRNLHALYVKSPVVPIRTCLRINTQIT